MQTPAAVVSESSKKPNGSGGAASASKPKGNGKAPPRKDDSEARRFGQLEAYKVRATIKTKTINIGDRRLAQTLDNKWRGMHHALHYLTDFARTQLKGRVVRAANRGLNLYMQEKMDEARHMLQTATDLAEQNGVDIGAHGAMTQVTLEVACPSENDVLEMIRLLDDYVIVIDSLWMERAVDDKKRDKAHEEVCAIVLTLARLLTRLRRKMIDYRHAKMNPSLTKADVEYEHELENIVLDLTGIDLKRMRQVEEAQKKATAPAIAAPPAKKTNGNGAGHTDLPVIAAVVPQAPAVLVYQ